MFPTRRQVWLSQNLALAENPCGTRGPNLFNQGRSGIAVTRSYADLKRKVRELAAIIEEPNTRGVLANSRPEPHLAGT
jgi:hypothetical protein